MGGSKGFALDLAPVDRVERLVDFLSRRVQPYRAELLVRHGAIEVTRGSWSKTITNPEFMLKPDDHVLMAEPPLPKAFLAALAKLDKDVFRDYAVSIGRGDTFDQLLSRCLSARPNTVNIGPQIKSIKGFLSALGTPRFSTLPPDNPHPRNPVRDLVLATHASQEGYLAHARLDDSSSEGINFEDLQHAVSKGTIRIPSEILEVRPRDAKGKPQGPNFIIKGCQLGQAIPYMEVLKEALGAARLIAPKYYQAAAPHSGPDGLIEYMLERFRIARPRRYASRDEAIRDFKKAAKARPEEFKRFGGVPVRDAQWDAWIPKKIHPDRPEPLDTEVPEKAQAFGRPIAAPGFYVYEEDSWEGRVSGTTHIPLSKDPVTEDRRKAAVLEHLRSNDPRVSDSHEFPTYRRLGYGSMTELMDGYSWTFKWDGSKNELSWQGSRHIYTLRRPIIDKTGNWVINFFPSKSGEKAISLLEEGDPLFYATV